jgi:hypothetical protein
MMRVVKGTRALPHCNRSSGAELAARAGALTRRHFSSSPTNSSSQVFKLARICAICALSASIFGTRVCGPAAASADSEAPGVPRCPLAPLTEMQASAVHAKPQCTCQSQLSQAGAAAGRVRWAVAGARGGHGGGGARGESAPGVGVLLCESSNAACGASASTASAHCLRDAPGERDTNAACGAGGGGRDPVRAAGLLPASAEPAAHGGGPSALLPGCPGHEPTSRFVSEHCYTRCVPPQ